MKFIRISTLSCVIIILTISLNSQLFASEEYNFRQTKWGISKEEVKTSESAAIDESLSKHDTLSYNSEIFGEKVLILYKFSFNKLIWAKYILSRYLFEKEKVIAPAPIADFGKFEKILEKKYGKTKDRGVKFKTKELRDKLSNYIKNEQDKESTELADKLIREGKAWWYSTWETKDTLILLYLHGNKGRIIFEISYDSLKLKRLTDEDLL